MKLERKVKVTPHKREIHTHPTKGGTSIKYFHAERTYSTYEMKLSKRGLVNLQTLDGIII